MLLSSETMVFEGLGDQKIDDFPTFFRFFPESAPRSSPEGPGPPFWLHLGSLLEPFRDHVDVCGRFFR